MNREYDLSLPAVPGMRRHVNPNPRQRMNRPHTANATSRSLHPVQGQAQPLKALSSTWRTTSTDMSTIASMNATLQRPKSAGGNHTSSSNNSSVRQGPSDDTPWSNQPAKTILRFNAYSTEPVSNGGNTDTSSNFRVRKFVILFYVEDSSVLIDEPKVLNSGIAQGRFMKRICIVNPDTSQLFAPGDFGVGRELVINSRTFTICDVDDGTRNWYYNTLGVMLGGKVNVPDDGYSMLRESRGIPKKRPSTSNGAIGSSNSGSGVQGGGGGGGKGAFFTKQPIVLTFTCAYQDDKPNGLRSDYLLYYYVLNDTIEIKEVPSQGRHNFPNLLRRMKLPAKGSLFVPNGIGGAMDKPSDIIERPSQEYITYTDLICGRSLNIYGRKVLLVSCDERSTEWYRQKGITQRALKLSVSNGEENVGGRVPAFNGFGSEDDLYAMGSSLEPKVIDTNLSDFTRFMRAKGKVLRFLATLSSPTIQDASRSFVINYFLATDQVSVYEPPVRNSGIWGGLFLGKGKYKKYIKAEGIDGDVDTPVGGGRGGRGGALSRWLKASDFYIGANITFEMPSTGSKLFTLSVKGYDDYTKKIMTDDKAEFPQSSTDLDIARLSEKFVATRLPIRLIFREADSYGRNSIEASAFRRIVRDIESEANRSSTSVNLYDLPESELLSICSDFGEETDEGLMVHYNDFIDLMVLAAPRTAREYERDRQGTFAFSVEERMLKVMRTHFDSAGTSRLRQSFRHCDQSGAGFIDITSYKSCLRLHKFHTIMTERAADALRMQYDTNADGTLDYNSMCDAIHPGDFDKYIDHYIGPKTYGEKAATTARARSSAPLLSATVKHEGEGLTKDEYLSKMNAENFSFAGDLKLQLTRSFNSFSSCFARHNRKKQVRKHMTAFDVHRTNTITKDQFLTAIDEVTAEFFIDFDKRDRELISEYLFANEDVRIDYESLLTCICSRDVKMAERLRKQSMERHVDNDKLFLIVDEQRSRDFGGTLNLFAG